jgi:phosphoesterase RecJ-like protein
MRVEEDGRLLLLVLSRALMEETGALASDTEGFVDVARTVKGSEGIALLMERDDGVVKVSLRSRGRMNVNRVASAFGGGGHRLASGASLSGPLDAACDRIRQGLREELARIDSDPAASAT